MTFNKWLKQQAHRDDPVGDLAEDVRRDTRPAPRNTLTAWKDYLWYGGAVAPVLATLDEAWKEYESEIYE